MQEHFKYRKDKDRQIFLYLPNDRNLAKRDGYFKNEVLCGVDKYLKSITFCMFREIYTLSTLKTGILSIISRSVSTIQQY